MFKSQKIITSTPEQTFAQGKKFSQHLSKGMIVLLEGELGAGKTTFVKGVVEGLLGKGWADRVSSPTFTMAHEYEGDHRIIHLDLYRISSLDDSQDREIESMVSGDAIVLVEWSSKRKKIFEKCNWVVELCHMGENKRELLISKK